MKIEKHFNWDAPCIQIDKDCFGLEITDGELRILCEWDYGYGGRGQEFMTIPLPVLEQLIAEYTLHKAARAIVAEADKLNERREG